MGNLESSKRIVPSVVISPQSTLSNNKILGRSVECFDYLKSLPYNFASSDLEVLLQIFSAIDIDSKNVISVKSILLYFSIECTPCNFKTFSHLNPNLKSSQYINFTEFVVILWSFLSLSIENMKMFILSAFDVDECHYDNPITLRQIINMIHFVQDDLDFECKLENISQYQNTLTTRRNAYTFIHTDNVSPKTKSDDLIVLDEMLVTPIQTLQIQMSSKIFTTEYWNNKMVLRNQLPSTLYNSRQTINYLRQSVTRILSKILDNNLAIEMNGNKSPIEKDTSIIITYGCTTTLDDFSEHELRSGLAHDIRIENVDEGMNVIMVELR
jgi:hypothetical protein